MAFFANLNDNQVLEILRDDNTYSLPFDEFSKPKFSFHGANVDSHFLKVLILSRTHRLISFQIMFITHKMTLIVCYILVPYQCFLCIISQVYLITWIHFS